MAEAMSMAANPLAHPDAVCRAASCRAWQLNGATCSDLGAFGCSHCCGMDEAMSMAANPPLGASNSSVVQANSRPDPLAHPLAVCRAASCRAWQLNGATCSDLGAFGCSHCCGMDEAILMA